MGATLLGIIQSGVENLDSDVGLCAPDAESHTLFAGLFNPVIEDYHGGFKATDKHPLTNFGNLSTLANVDPDDQFVISTGVRCGRSLQGYPFSPCLTEAQYREMEEKVSSTLRMLEGELKVTNYPLTGINKTQQQLIDDHFFFKEADRFLQAAIAAIKTKRSLPPKRGGGGGGAASRHALQSEPEHRENWSFLPTLRHRRMDCSPQVSPSIIQNRDLVNCDSILPAQVRALRKQRARDESQVCEVWVGTTRPHFVSFLGFGSPEQRVNVHVG
ncbi:arginine kinase Pro c 2.0101-like [Ixodes scapularis]